MSRHSVVKRAKIDRGRRIISMIVHPPLHGIWPGDWVTLSIMHGQWLKFVGANLSWLHQFMRPKRR